MSDTITLQPAAMREAMMSAEGGGDVYGEDPSGNRLQKRVAEILGKEASRYFPTGTMCNLVAHMTHCLPGDEVICGAAAHTFNSETAGPERIAGVSVRTIPQSGAGLDPLDVERAIRFISRARPCSGSNSRAVATRCRLSNCRDCTAWRSRVA